MKRLPSPFPCTLDDCAGSLYARGMCYIHYHRLNVYGRTGLLPVLSAAERLAAKLERKPNGCLEWTGRAGNGLGYGKIHFNGKQVYTHRVAWELVNGPIPNGLYILHSCDNPPCCELTHLSLGTHAENMADMVAKGRQPGHGITHCPAGHAYTEANTYLDPRGHRFCRTCRKSTSAARYQARKGL